MKKKNFSNLIRWLFLLGIASLLSACNQLMSTQVDHTSKTKEGSSMNLAYRLENKPIEIPAMDAAAPAEFKTASFGLG